MRRYELGWILLFLFLAGLFIGFPVLGQQKNPNPQEAKANLRILKKGDWWEYSSSTVVRMGPRGLRVGETRKITILNETKTSPKGQECLIYSIETTGIDPSGQPQTRRSEAYITQDKEGTIYMHGRYREEKDQVLWVTDPPEGYVLDTKSPLSVGTSWSSRFTFNDGSKGEQTAKVLRRDMIEVPAGKFMCYQVKTELLETDGEKITVIDWYSPEIGASVLSVALVRTPEGMTILACDALVRYGSTQRS